MVVDIEPQLHTQLCTGEPPVAERRGETDADDANAVLSNPLVSSDSDQAAAAAAAESKTPADNTELVTRPPADDRPDEREACAANIPYNPPSQIETPVDERPGEQASGETGTAQRPPQGSLMARILELIERSDRPKRPWQVQKELNLPRLPSAELSRLLTMGCLTRPKEGIYAVPGRNYGGLG